MTQQDQSRNKGHEGGGTPVLEWISAAAGLVITLGLPGFIGWHAWTGADTPPPVIEIRTEGITPVAGGHVVEVVAENLSPTTAAAVAIEGELKKDGQSIATARASLSYVPGHSERQGGLFFKEDARTHALELRALGYARP